MKKTKGSNAPTLEDQRIQRYYHDGPVLETGEFDFEQYGPVEIEQRRYELADKPSWVKYRR